MGYRITPSFCWTDCGGGDFFFAFAGMYLGREIYILGSIYLGGNVT